MDFLLHYLPQCIVGIIEAYLRFYGVLTARHCLLPSFVLELYTMDH